jgi:nicotinic acid mononucleotide adenylyltransferase
MNPSMTIRTLRHVEGVTGLFVIVSTFRRFSQMDVDAVTFCVGVGGSFNPVHAGHVEMLVIAKRILEQEYPGCIVKGHLAVAPQGHVRGKLGARGAMREHHRLEMGRLAVQHLDWVVPTTRCYGSASSCIGALAGSAKCIAVDVVGGDRAHPERTVKACNKLVIMIGREGHTKHIEDELRCTVEPGKHCKFPNDVKKFFYQSNSDTFHHISSTLIRKAIEGRDTRAMVENGFLAPEVADYIEQQFDSLYDEK